MTFKAVAMKMGFAESARLSWLVFESDTNFKTKKEALASLTIMLYNKYLSKLEIIRQCCKQTLQNNADSRYCFMCGIKIKDTNFDPEKFQQYLFELGGFINDEAGYEEDTGDIDNPDGWKSYTFDFGYTKKQIVIIEEQAEIQITKMLVRLKPEIFIGEYKDYGFKDADGYENETTEIALDKILSQ